MSKITVTFNFENPTDLASFLSRVSGQPVATSAPATAPVSNTAPSPAANMFGATMPQTGMQQTGMAPVQFNPMQNQMNAAPVDYLPQIVAKATQLCTAGKQNEVGAVVQQEFGLAKLGDCPPALQANLLNRLNQLG